MSYPTFHLRFKTCPKATEMLELKCLTLNRLKNATLNNCVKEGGVARNPRGQGRVSRRLSCSTCIIETLPFSSLNRFLSLRKTFSGSGVFVPSESVDKVAGITYSFAIFRVAKSSKKRNPTARYRFKALIGYFLRSEQTEGLACTTSQKLRVLPRPYSGKVKGTNGGGQKWKMNVEYG